jgi:hypothetical protein
MLSWGLCAPSSAWGLRGLEPIKPRIVAKIGILWLPDPWAPISLGNVSKHKQKNVYHTSHCGLSQ